MRVTVGARALFRHGDKWPVYVVDRGRVHRTLLESGHQTGQYAEVVSGLAEGARVILLLETRCDGDNIRALRLSEALRLLQPSGRNPPLDLRPIGADAKLRQKLGEVVG
jgi:hypothetical protein